MLPFLPKSFLFEVVDSNSQRIEASFTLILPPQSYSIKEKQRVNITKTFGNAFVDDYGPDNLELTIKGISGTAHVFPTFKTTGISSGITTFDSNERVLNLTQQNSPNGFTGKSAFYHFRDNIMRYKDNPNFDQKELRVYDLADLQAYKCILLEFGLDRSADKPLHYPFTISLFVYARFGSKEVTNIKSIDISKNPLNALDNLLEAMNNFEKEFIVFKVVQGIKNATARLKNQITLISAKFKSWLVSGRNVIESPLNLIKQGIETIGILGNAIYEAYRQGKISYEMWVKAGENIQNQWREMLSIYGFTIQEGTKSSKASVIERYSGMDYVSNARNAVPTTTEESFNFTGYNSYTVKGGDTLQSIALNLLGDEDLWPHIAAANSNITSNYDIQPGMEILVPVESDAISQSKDSFILTEDTDRNPYGTDIKVDSSGNMVLNESNDTALIGGVENVIQAIDIRLGTLTGSMIKQTAFGLMTNIGMAGTDQAINYLKMNLQNSLIQDPRIQTVSNIRVTIKGDTIQLGADVKLIGRDETIPISTVI